MISQLPIISYQINRYKKVSDTVAEWRKLDWAAETDWPKEVALSPRSNQQPLILLPSRSTSAVLFVCRFAFAHGVNSLGSDLWEPNLLHFRRLPSFSVSIRDFVAVETIFSIAEMRYQSKKNHAYIWRRAASILIIDNSAMLIISTPPVLQWIYTRMSRKENLCWIGHVELWLRSCTFQHPTWGRTVDRPFWSSLTNLSYSSASKIHRHLLLVEPKGPDQWLCMGKGRG